MTANPAKRVPPIRERASPVEVAKGNRRYYLQVLEEADALPADLSPAIADMRAAVYAAIEALTWAIDAHELGLGLQSGAQASADSVCRHADDLIRISTWRVAVYAATRPL